MVPKEDRKQTTSLLNTETLYILGNGFDLAHGMKSKQDEFGKYLRRADSFVHELVESCLKGEDWNTFEESLKDPMLVIGPLMEQAISSVDICSPGSKDWSDSMNFAFQTSMDLHTTLAKHFEDWAHQIELPCDTVVDFEPQALFITFNYTRTLEDLYKIDERQILHIHGIVDSADDLLFGHNEPERYSRKELPDYVFDEFYGDLDPDEEIAFDIAYGAIERMHKDVIGIAKAHEDFFNRLKTVSKIIIMGKSYSTIDKHYFELVELITRANNPSWNISWYEPGEDETAVDFLTDIGVPHEKIKLFKIGDPI